MSIWIHLTSDVCGVEGTRLHAVNPLRSPKIKRKTHDAKCGKRVRLLGFGVEGHPGAAMTAAWPPYVKDARGWGFERCADCWRLAPGQPKRPAFATSGAA